MRSFRYIAAVIGLITLLVPALPGALFISPTTVHAQDDASWLLGQINDLRAGLGLHAYSLNGQLSAAATQHSQYMADTCDVSHTEANGSTPTSRARANGYTGDWISENIYMGSNARAIDAWNFWLNSGIHYQGMTHATVNEIGIGVAHGSCGHGFTLLFGHRADVSAPPAPPPADTGNDPPPATRYVPPPSTITPTPTVPTLTPSHTWTITPTFTPSLTHTPTLPATVTSTAAPLILPTVPAPDDLASATAVAVAQVPTVTSLPPTLLPTATHAPASPDRDSGSNSNGRTLLLVLLLGGAVVLGGTGIAILWRARM